MICAHPTTDPVTLSTGDVVAHICRTCNATIPHPAWVDIPPKLLDYATDPPPATTLTGAGTHTHLEPGGRPTWIESTTSGSYPAFLARVAHRMWTDLTPDERSYLLYRTIVITLWLAAGLYLIWTGPAPLAHHLATFVHHLATGAAA